MPAISLPRPRLGTAVVLAVFPLAAIWFPCVVKRRNESHITYIKRDRGNVKFSYQGRTHNGPVPESVRLSQGQSYRECGPLGGPGMHHELAAMSFDNSMHDGKA